MEMKKCKDKVILGLDVGIGSVGWAIINSNKGRIEDLGVRIFESGEENAKKSADRASQQARSFRARRRLNRRNKQRKDDLKNFLESIGFMSVAEIDNAFKSHQNNNNVVLLRAKGLDEKLSELDIVAILLNMANYRGYSDFYEEEDKKKRGKLEAAIHAIETLMETNKYRTIGELFYSNEQFKLGNSKFSSYRNNEDYKYLINRQYLKDEVRLLLCKQSEYYSMLTADVNEHILNIIFRQRDFEDGPGPKDLKHREQMLENAKGHRVYTGFSDLIGNCTYLKNEQRGTRNSVVFDVFSLINDLSQMLFFDENGEMTTEYNQNILEDCIAYLFESNGVMKIKQFSSILSKYGLKFDDPLHRKQLGTYKYIKFLTDDKIFDEKYINEFKQESIKYNNTENISYKLGRILSMYITPSKRKKEIATLLEECSDACLKQLSLVKSSGTCNLSDKFMSMSIDAFSKGVRYGEFQAQFIKESEDNDDYLLVKNGKLLPLRDKDLIVNPVVFKSVNETRKIINALLDEYDISRVHIEVAKEVGRSFEQRNEIRKSQLENQEVRLNVENELYDLMHVYDVNRPITPKMQERYVLWKSQNQKCIYTGTDIPFTSIIETDNTVQVDHIIPQSIVLDDTLANKVLVMRSANARKGNRLPLECMGEEGFVSRKEFLQTINDLKLSNKKNKYLKLEELSDEIVAEFVSRNLNDTRYITKYITNYLKKAFVQMEKDIDVMSIKGNVTSRFRKRWLREYTDNGVVPSIYSFDDKGRNLHYYHHAVDAVIIANLKQEYVALANGYERIQSIKNDRNIIDKSYVIQREKIKLVDMMESYYHMKREYVESLLEKQYVPSICNRLKDQIEKFIPLEFEYVENKNAYMFGKDTVDFKKFKYLHKKIQLAVKNKEDYTSLVKPMNELSNKLGLGFVYREDGTYIEGKEVKTIEKQQIDKLEPKLEDYIKNINFVHQDAYVERIKSVVYDEEFFERIKVPYVSYRIDRKFSDTFVTSDNPVSFEEIKKKYGFNTIEEFETYLNTDESIKCPYYLKYNGEYLDKKNYTIYEANKYYCTEIYLDDKGKSGMRGIRYMDLQRKDGKLILKKPLPEGYVHVMYLFKNEHISICDGKGQIKNNGFGAYRGVKSVNRNNVIMRLISNKNIKGEDIVLGISSNITKHEIDILGKYRGDIKCGDQLSFTTEKD